MYFGHINLKYFLMHKVTPKKQANKTFFFAIKTFITLLLLFLGLIFINISVGGVLFVYIWLPYQTHIGIKIGLLVSMLLASIPPPFLIAKLYKKEPDKNFLFCVAGIISLCSLLGIDCFRLVYQTFTPNPIHSTTIGKFMWYNLTNLNFVLERLSDELHRNFFHLCYYFGGLTCTTLTFYQVHYAIMPKVSHKADAENGANQTTHTSS